GGQTVRYDSARDDEHAPLAGIFRAMADTEVKWVLAPDFKVLKVQGGLDVIQGLRRGNPGVPGFQPSLYVILVQDALRPRADLALAHLLRGVVRKGHTWEQGNILCVGVVGTASPTHRCTYEGRQGSFHKVRVDSRLLKFRVLE